MAPKNFDEIRNKIEDAYYDADLEVISYSRRTLQRDISEIKDLFNIEICCGTDSLYYIKRDDSALAEINLRMIEMFDIQHSLSSQKNIEQYVQLQPSCVRGSEYISPLLNACNRCIIVSFSYRFVWEEYDDLKIVQPYGLKEFDKMWYLVAWDTEKKEFYEFGLDRIRDLKFTDNTFVRKDDFSLEKYFQHYYGVWRDRDYDEKPVVVRLCSTSKYANYLTAVPLHSTQRLISENEDECIFELKLCPSWNFVQKLMTMADQVRVLAPISLREELIRTFEYDIKYQHYNR